MADRALDHLSGELVGPARLELTRLARLRGGAEARVDQRRRQQDGSCEGDDKPEQSSEAKVGPYELQDFHLYYVLRYGFAPSKVAFLAHTAWHDRSVGAWPDGPEVGRNQYGIAEIKAHLGTFVYRFFKTSQFKRSCVPNAPKVGSGGSLSPRGDWRAPSDSEATVWLAELAGVPESI